MRYKILLIEWKVHIKILTAAEVIQKNVMGLVFILLQPHPPHPPSLTLFGIGLRYDDMSVATKCPNL